MPNNCCTFSNAASKSVKRSLSALGLALFFFTQSVMAEDLTQITVVPLQEVQKNQNTAYQIGDRITLLAQIKSAGLENGDHLNLKLPEGSSKIEDQGWYLDPSTQFMSGSFRFVASPIQVGTLTLPTLLIVKDDQTIIARTLPFGIKVTGPQKTGKSELLEITPSTLATKYWVMFSIITLVVMLCVSYFVYRYLKNRRKKPKNKPKARIEADHVIALRKIDSLYQLYPYSVDHLKPLAFGVSETLKEFFSHRFKVDATESTTDEMLALLKKEAVSSDSLRDIKILFQDLDLIKFTSTENYRNFDEGKYLDFKVKAQLIIQKWILHTQAGEPTA
jgi:hypothetical protein